MAVIDVAKIRYVLEFQGKDAEAGMKRIGNAFGTLRKIVTTVIAGKFVKDAALFGKEITLLSNRTGMSIDKLTALRNVFIAAGSGARGFQATIEKINHGLLGLQRGQTEWATKLYPMGISPWGKGADEILYEIADWAKNAQAMGTSKEQVLDYLIHDVGIDEYTAQQLLGGSEAYKAEQERLKQKVGVARNVEDLQALNKALNELDAAWQNAKNNIIGYLAPAITMLISGLTDLVRFLGENELLGAVVAVTVAIAGLVGQTKMLAWFLGLLGLGKGAAAAGGVATAGGAAAGGIGAGTVLLAGALIGVIVDSIWECYDMITSGEIRGPIGKVFKALFEVIIDSFTGVWDWIKEKGNNTWEGIKKWYEKVRMENDSAKTFYYGFQKDAIDNAAKEKTEALLYRPTPDIIAFDKPFLEDLATVFGNEIPSGGMSIVNENHFEGSTFGSDLPQTEEAIESAMSNVTSWVGAM